MVCMQSKVLQKSLSCDLLKMDETYVYEKSVEDRLSDYNEILRIDGRSIPASQIQREWSYHLELAIDPAGWQALWKIPQKDCEFYEIAYPNIVIVYVEDISFITLVARAKVIAVKNDIHLPEQLEVNLIDLYPTIEQDQTIALNMSSTAENIDMLRYFYNNVWMPWDQDDDETDWPSVHLESRVRLSFDLKSGSMPRNVLVKIKSLINEGKSIIDKLRTLEEDLGDCDEIEAVNPKKIYELTTLNIRLVQIRTEFEIYENVELRKVLISEQKQEIILSKPKNWVVLTSKSISEHIKYLQAYENLNPDTVPQTAVTLKNALRNANIFDKIYLDNGIYQVNSLDNLESGGKIQGLFDSVIIHDEDKVITLFEIFGKDVQFENLHLRLKYATTGISVKQGRVIMKDCTLNCEEKSFIRQGILVHSGCELIMENCNLSGFNFAIVCKPNGKIHLSNCTLKQNNTGIMLFDGSNITIEDCFIQECLDYGICFESLNMPSGIVNIEEFKSVPGILLSNIKLENNIKGDIKIIEKKTSIKQLCAGVTPMKKSHFKENLQEKLCDLKDDVDMEGISPLS
ncbi:protein nessun dorma [Chrysoperla carnea]|uniref:protein nessun dorma n=1 Tax=Chrysoperla carnea TaxID=189513 RepID=UPI001D083D0E|nr:protein nessun dorma [Chrysoperla carnea]